MLNKTDNLYMGLAREIARQNTCCYSRKIGSVIYDPVQDVIVGIGYNGPARKVPHCDNPEYRKFLHEKVMTIQDQLLLDSTCGVEAFVAGNDKTCPRRLMKYPSGQGLHLCQAGHSERNGLLASARGNHSTVGCTLYAYCGLPCNVCMIELINSGIKRIVCLKTEKDYDNLASWLVEHSDIELVKVEESEIK